MIEGIRDYVVHLTATTLICAVVFRFTRGSCAVKMIMKLLCGIVLAYSMIQPVKQMQFSGMKAFTQEFREEADRAAQQGKNVSQTAWVESITQGMEAYILEKTKSMNVDLLVEVKLSDDEVPVPVGIKLVGQVAPYVKSVLSDMIEQDLNISKEYQTWVSK